MMSATTFRIATLNDLPVLKKFEQGIVEAERPYNPTLKSGNISYYDLAQLIQSDEAEVFVGELDGQIICSGYVKIKTAKTFLQYDRYAYLGFMYVLPDYRGRGINQLLTQELLNWAKARNLSEFRLTVYDDNLPAVRAYEKVGFEKLITEMRLEI
ncbi:MAG: GNAT family N-acetyltransferase [Bacteroidota bacterium]